MGESMQHANHTIPAPLADFFARHPRIALAFSGGVDSAYLLYAAAACGADVRAYMVRSQFQPAFEQADAMRLSQSLDVSLTIVTYDILQHEGVACNGPDRCYLCKHALFSALLRRSRAEGYPLLMDGTNASDDVDDRPGFRAVTELGVLSPLRDSGITKAQVRALSREAGLFTWGKPAYACLATRVPTGTRITPDDLRRIERAEAALHALGFSDLRVRLRGEDALIQLPAGQMLRLAEIHGQVVQALAPDFRGVLLDLMPRKGE